MLPTRLEYQEKINSKPTKSDGRLNKSFVLLKQN